MEDILYTLKNEFFKFPIANEKEENFKKFILEKLGTYENMIRDINDKDRDYIINKVSYLCNQIKISLEEYYNGFPYKAFNNLSEGLNSIKDNMECIGENSDSIENYYRARKSDKTLNREEMFHIPFESRKKIDNQRYSIAGFPCLYLGLTPYTCWEELDRPLPNEFVVSLVKLDKSMNILNFAILPYEVKDMIYKKIRNISDKEVELEKDREFLTSYLICLPIIMASSVKVNDRKATFREEYIVPQMVTQWIRTQGDVDGIQYYSTKTSTYSRRNALLYKNIVIPTKDKSSDNGYCSELCKLISITDSIICTDIELFSEKYKKDSSIITDQSNGLINKFIIKAGDSGKKVYEEYVNGQIHYSSSGFMEIKKNLIDMELKHIEK